MRPERTLQASIFDLFAGHEIGRELKAMSAWLDDQSAVIGRVAEDLRQRGRKPTGVTDCRQSRCFGARCSSSIAS